MPRNTMKSRRVTIGKASASANDAAHRELMQQLKKMTPRQVLETSVRVGIHTKSGKLTKRYAPESTRARR